MFVTGYSSSVQESGVEICSCSHSYANGATDRSSVMMGSSITSSQKSFLCVLILFSCVQEVQTVLLQDDGGSCFQSCFLTLLFQNEGNCAYCT